ncbi:hypothetical protein J5N97_001040 [Dioscorea zingiberensis]|uniref:Uncharacterized protein n=1 Tax=Dioscorea zingiberensis TaxID=325984 RepID=A0A9D5H2H5_9LILI|nr:hypothetical protein J5N97_001040 [Dioscorea zingiberensis]
MAKALQQCPSSGILWAASIEMVPRPQRKRRSADALNRTNKDAHVIAAVAKLFWHERKLDAARDWFNQAVTLAPDIGDFWAWAIQYGSKFLSNGQPGTAQNVDKSTSLFKFVNDLHALISPPSQGTPLPLILLGKSKNALVSTFLFLNQVVFNRTGIYKGIVFIDDGMQSLHFLSEELLHDLFHNVRFGHAVHNFDFFFKFD